MGLGLATALGVAFAASATTYEVGPGHSYPALGGVPWEKLAPGDTVLIYARPTPYREKILIARAGVKGAPITVRGVPDADGQLPIIDGDGAVTRLELDYWGDTRGVIKVGGSTKPADTMPAWIVLENLDVRGARLPATFRSANGARVPYTHNAAAIYVEKCEHLVIRGCRLHGCANGLFVSSNNERASRDITVERCEIFDNGVEGSGLQHNAYTAAIGISFLNNRFGPLHTNALGNSLKDRSAGLLVSGNRFEGGNKTIDLVDAQDSHLIRDDPRWQEAVVTDNVILKLPRDRHNFVVNYGGDGNTPAEFRSGPLVFTHNTVVSRRTGETVLFNLSTPAQSVQCESNVVVTLSAKARLTVLDGAGQVTLARNWFSEGWKKVPPKGSASLVTETSAQLSGREPGFVDEVKDDFRLKPEAQAKGLGVRWSL